MSDESPKDQWPSIGLAYEFVGPSYEWMLDRLNAANTRIQQLQAFAATVTFAAPVLGRALAPDASLASGWLYLALAMFVIITALGIGAIWVGTVKLLDPGILHSDHLDKERWRFQADLIYRAGEAVEHNGRLVNQKWNFAIGMTIAFGIEILSLTAWLLVL